MPSMPLPKEAKAALARVDDMHENIAAIRIAVEAIADIANAYARRDGVTTDAT